MRFSSIFLTLGAAACLASPGFAGAKKHNHFSDAAQALHRIHLAAKEKKEWRQHLAKLHSLPHAERIAEKRHERVWKHKHDAKVEAMQSAHAAKVASLIAEAKKVKRAQKHQARLARGKHHAALVIVQAIARKPRVNLYTRHLAAIYAARAAAHQANVVHKLTAVRARYAQQAAFHALRLANHMAAYRAHLANLEAAHNARLAAGRAHWVALHGDGSGGKSIRFWQTASAGVPVKVISVDLNDPNIKVSAVMARQGNGTAEPFRQMIERANPNVAVTGTFFSLDDLQPIGDIVIDGSLVHFGGMGTALCITPDNHADMVTCDWGRHHDWSQYDFVCACGPRLLRRGRVVLDPHSERFGDRHMLSPNSRIAVGITRGNTLFFAMTHEPIYLGHLARVMQSLGASEAMNLDAGTSTGFYYNGATLARPGRKLTNMIVVYGRRDRYEHSLDQLIPSAYRRSAYRYRHQVSQSLPGRQ